MDNQLMLQLAEYYQENSINPSINNDVYVFYQALRLSQKYKNYPIQQPHCSICGQQFTHIQQDDILRCCICHQQMHATCDKILNISYIDKDSYKCPHCRQMYFEKHPYWLNDAVSIDPTIDYPEKPKRRNKNNASKAITTSTSVTDTNNQILTLQIQKYPQQQKSIFKYSSEEIKSLENWVGYQLDTCHQTPNHKKLFSDTTNTACIIYVNNIFNGAKINGANLFQSLQETIKKEAKVKQENQQQLYKQFNSKQDDVNTFNIQSLIIDQYTNHDQDKKISFLRQLNMDTKFTKWQQLTPIIVQDKQHRSTCSVFLVKQFYNYIEQLRVQYLATLIPGIVQTIAYISRGEILSIENAIEISEEEIRQVINQQIQNTYLPPKKLLSQFNKNDEIYTQIKNKFCQGSQLTKRQIFDLKERQFDFYPYCALVRQTLLIAIVNVNLGQNALEKQLTTQGVNILIKFGYESLLDYTEIHSKYLSYQTQLGEEMIFRKDQVEDYDTTDGDIIIDQDQQQEQMRDFDILETPESVLMIMNCIGNILKSKGYI